MKGHLPEFPAYTDTVDFGVHGLAATDLVPGATVECHAQTIRSSKDPPQVACTVRVAVLGIQQERPQSGTDYIEKDGAFYLVKVLEMRDRCYCNKWKKLAAAGAAAVGG